MFRSLRIAAVFIVLGLLLGAGAAVALNMVFPATPDARTAGVNANGTPVPESTITITSAAPPPNSLVYTQEEVNTQVTRTLRELNSPVPLRDVEVKLLGDNRVEATAQATMPFQGDVPVNVTMSVAGSGGKLKVNVESVKAGGMPLPQSIVQQLVGQMMTAAGINDLNNIDLPQGFDSVTVEQGRVVVRKRA